MQSSIVINERSITESNFEDITFEYLPKMTESELQEFKVVKAEQELLENVVTKLKADRVYKYGNNSDGVIESAVAIGDRGVVEIGYYYGDLKPKSIIKVSTQKGCPARCGFCNAGAEEFLGNLTGLEIYEQAALMLQIVAALNVPSKEQKHKVNFAGTGEPLLNPNLPEALERLAKHELSFKVATVLPKAKISYANLEKIAKFAGAYSGTLQLQISLISSDQDFREQQVGLDLPNSEELIELAKLWRSYKPKREQINLSLILSSDTPVDAEYLMNCFPKEFFRFRFRNYIPTENGAQNDLLTIPGEKLESIKQQFSSRGYHAGSEATPTATEQKYNLASNVTRSRMSGGSINKKLSKKISKK